jgi:hypothetical protein
MARLVVKARIVCAPEVRTARLSVQTELHHSVSQLHVDPMRTVALATAALSRLVMVMSVFRLLSSGAQTPLRDCAGWRNLLDTRIGAVPSLFRMMIIEYFRAMMGES